VDYLGALSPRSTIIILFMSRLGIPMLETAFVTTGTISVCAIKP